MSSATRLQEPKEDCWESLPTSYHPHYGSRLPFLSRATRTTLHFNLAVPELVFLKDYWRVNFETTREEDAIYSILETKEARNMTPFGMHNNASDNKALTQTMTIEPRAISTEGKIHLSHHKMSLDVASQNLIQVESPCKFISAVADAMEAHDSAYFDADILQGDVSVGNILITDDNKGLLVDWDNSLKSTSANTRRPSRTQFMSAMLLDDPRRPHAIEDDRESAFYVLLWVSMRHLENSIRHRLYPDEDPSTLVPNLPSDNVVRAFNEVYFDRNGNAKGGWIKKWLLTSDILSRLEFSNHPELENLVEELGEFLDVRYARRPKPTDFEVLKDADCLVQQYPDMGCLRRIRSGLPAYRYQNRVSQLKAKYWFVNTLGKHLENLQLARRRS